MHERMTHQQRIEDRARFYNHEVSRTNRLQKCSQLSPVVPAERCLVPDSDSTDSFASGGHSVPLAINEPQTISRTL